MMKPCVSVLIIACAVLSPFDDVIAACSCEWICIKPAISDGETRLQALNSSSVPLTFSIQFNTRKYRVEGPARLTKTLAAGDSVLLPVVEPADGVGGSRQVYHCQWTIGNTNAEHDDQLEYMLPYASGQSFRVLQGFGSRFSHTGTEQFAVDFKMDEGTPVHAARGGVVARTVASNSRGCWKDDCAGYANYIVILHDDETTGEYYHLQKDGVLVKVGDRVVAGQKIGLSGNTGHSALPHLHFGVYRAIDQGQEQSVPFRFLSADGIVEQPRRGGMYVAVKSRESIDHDTQPAASQAGQTTGAANPPTKVF
jgi:murein DD-endopeptidase MepM/ murein hydrolase activator NlpD